MESLEDYLSTIFAWTNEIERNVCDFKLSVSPLTYLDKHIDDHLSLAMVRPLPGIVPLLLRLCDVVVSSYRTKHPDMKPRDLSSWHSLRSFSIGSADRTAGRHQQAAIVLRRFVSTVLLCSESANIITANVLPGDTETSVATAARTVRIRHQGARTPEEGIKDSTGHKLDALQKYYPNLAVWYFVTSSGGQDELIIRKLGGTRARKPKWTTPQTSGTAISSFSPLPTEQSPPDAPSPPWSSLLQDKNHNTRSTGTNVISVHRNTTPDIDTPLASHTGLKLMTTPKEAGLTLSEQIQRSSSSIVVDMNESGFDTEQLKHSTSVTRSTRDEQANETRYTSNFSILEMKCETQSRKLMLVNFSHDHYHRSPRPASYLQREVIYSKGRIVATNFVQPNPKNSYPPSDYMILTVGDYIGWGASGTVYKATLSVKGEHNSTHMLHKVAVKFVTKDLAKWKLEREYWVYQHLEAAKVAGIPAMFGLFQDLEENWMVLVMSYTGITLGTRHMSLKANEQLVSQTESLFTMDFGSGKPFSAFLETYIARVFVIEI
ncbi:hypothetical protein AX16_004959 [Volvariella volvacea WC 439]|nr:hypothetical protein AX16_004959 [Volvariella volvacea WC 439]